MMIDKETLNMPAADLGSASRYPTFAFQMPDIRIIPENSLKPPEKERMFLNGRVALLPYTPQSNYNRERKESSFPVVAIESKWLKGTICPELGARLWSLTEKKTGRELLFRNPVFQPTNLAIRNAWFSGGIEWNGPIYGHNLLTCSPVYVARVNTPEGELVRAYEFDCRLEMAWQVDLWLPENEKCLWVHIRAINPNDADIDFYWWTNIAVAIEDGLRVLAPSTQQVIHHTPDQRVFRTSFPNDGGFDASYPLNHVDSTSLFFVPPPGKRPWIAACNEQGFGLAHTSTRNLPGRKFFVWGTGPGGRHWEDYLSEPGKGRYVEIQAGLTPTQLQTVSLRAREQISWTECILPLELDRDSIHGRDFFAAGDAVERVLDQRVPAERVAEVHHMMSRWEDIEPEKNMSTGSVWGALFEERTGRKVSPGMRFDADPTKGEAIWRNLLRLGSMTEATPEAPKEWVVSEGWMNVLRNAIEKSGPNYLQALHLGVGLLERGECGAAGKMFEISSRLQDNSYARRNLALIAEAEGKLSAALDLYWRAYTLSGEHPEIAEEIVGFLRRHGRNDELSEFVASLESEYDEMPERIELALAELALKRGDLDRAEMLLERNYATIREGETTLTDLWFDIQCARLEREIGKSMTILEKDRFMQGLTPPPQIDFRLRSRIR